MTPASPHWSIAVHGGAGNIARTALTAQQDSAYRASLAAAVKAGSACLQAGRAAVEAVEAAVIAMEEDPLFNAGKGAVFTADGRNELDAAIMDGATLKAGAVAGITHTRSPIRLARAVMDYSDHVMLVGEMAEVFGRGQGLEQVAPGYYFTEKRWRSLLDFAAAKGLPPPLRPKGMGSDEDKADLAHDEGKHGTVGAVACDAAGNVAAATSTGGITGKRWGRVGDSPIIGAGTYAANASCAVSATGAGEHFIRLSVARAIAALVALKGMPLQAAADHMIQNDLSALGGHGGIIATDTRGEIAWSFNTPGMYRGRANAHAHITVSLYGDEP
jgi:beta-aspartyl-peptidase (threonine type)